MGHIWFKNANALGAALFLLGLYSSQADAQEKMTPVKVAEGVYMFEHSRGSGNSTVVITDDGVLVLDFHIANADQTLAGIRKLTDKKVRYLISSHSNTEIHPGQGESAGVWFSNVKGWIEILDKIMQRNLPVDTYIPGHGPLHIGRGVKDLEEQKRYFVVMRDEVAKMIHAGKSLEQIEKEFKVPQEFAHYKRPERLKQFFKLFYNQLIGKGC